MSEKPSWLKKLEENEPTYSVGSGGSVTKTSAPKKTSSSNSTSKSTASSSSSSGSSKTSTSVEQQRANNSAIWHGEDKWQRANNPNYDPGNESTWTETQRRVHAENEALGGGGTTTNYAQTGGKVSTQTGGTASAQTGYNQAIPGTSTVTKTASYTSPQTTQTASTGTAATKYSPTYATNTANQSSIKNYGADYLKEIADMEPPSYNYDPASSDTSEYMSMLMSNLQSQQGAGANAYNTMSSAISTPADYYANMPDLPDFGSTQQSASQLPWMNALAGQGATQWVPTLASRQLTESTRQGDMDQLYKGLALQQQTDDSYLSRLLSAAQLSQSGDQYDRSQSLAEYTGEAGVQNDFLTRLLSGAQLAQQGEQADATLGLNYDQLQQGYDLANLDQDYKYDSLNAEQEYKNKLLRQQEYFGNIDAATALSQLFGTTVYPKNSGEDLFNQVGGMDTLTASQWNTEWPLQESQYSANIAKALNSGGGSGGGSSGGSSSVGSAQTAANNKAALDAQYAADYAEYLPRQEAYNNLSWYEKLRTVNPYDEFAAKYYD